MALLSQLSRRCRLQPRAAWRCSVRAASSYAVPRDPRFGRLEQHDVDYFRSVVGETGVVTDPDALQTYNTCAETGEATSVPRASSAVRASNAAPSLPRASSVALSASYTCRDWMGKYEGRCSVALRPKSTEQVSRLLAHCNQRVLAVVPQARASPVAPLH